MAKGINAADFEDVLAHLTEDSADVSGRLLLLWLINHWLLPLLLRCW